MVVAWVGCLISTNLAAQTLQTRTLRFVTDIFPGLVIDQGSGRVCGLAPYLTKAAVTAMGYRHELEVLPLPRALKAIASSSKDGIISIYKTEEREKFITFTSFPIYTDVLRVFSRQGDVIPWDETMESLRPYRIGVMQGWYYSDRFQALKVDDPSFRFEWIPLRESGFKMLRAKRIDVLISNDRNLQNFYQTDKSVEGKTQDIVALNPPMEQKGIYIGFSRKVPAEVVNAFDHALIQLLKDPRTLKAMESPASFCPHP